MNDNKINILWLVDHLGYAGVLHGAGKYYLNTIPFFNKNKFNVILCVVRAEDNLTKYFKDEGIQVKHLGRSKFDPFVLNDLFKLVRSMNISLIHTHGYGSDNFGRIAGAFLRVPTIVHAHDENKNYPWHQKLADLLLSRFTKKAIAVSESVKESCIKVRRIPENKLFMMHNGISIGDFIPLKTELLQKEKKRFNIEPASKVVGTIARLREEKGVKYLIESAAKILKVFPRTVFFIAGDGPLRENLENLSKNLGIYDKIIFAGFCDNVPAVLSIIDIFVAPSVTEGFGLGIVEAMAMGKPVIATRVGGIREILKDDETGLFIPPKNPDAISEKVIYLLKDDKETKRLGEKAIEESKKYDINTYVEELEKRYLELV